jgi:hypothetical protein
MNKNKQTERTGTVMPALAAQSKRFDAKLKQAPVENWIKTGQPGTQIAAGKADRFVHGLVTTQVLLIAHTTQPRVGKGLDRADCAVGRSVMHHYDFDVPVGLVEDGSNRLSDEFLEIVGRHADADQRLVLRIHIRA